MYVPVYMKAATQSDLLEQATLDLDFLVSSIFLDSASHNGFGNQERYTSHCPEIHNQGTKDAYMV